MTTTPDKHPPDAPASDPDCPGPERPDPARLDGELLGTDPDWPDFADLFGVCSCTREDCQRCGGWQLTPRTAAALWVTAGLTADDGYDDAAAHGDTPLTSTTLTSTTPGGQGEQWALFDRYPPLTHSRGAAWRRRAARAFDDLADDLAAGRWPQPQCPAEEMALHIILERVRDWAADPDGAFGAPPEKLAGLPAHPDDLDVDGALDALFADHDILLLSDPGHDGIEDPSSAENMATRIGDYRAAGWFISFTPGDARNPNRGFRRR